MPQKDIRDILGLEEGESLVREKVNKKELTKRLQKVAEYKEIAQRRKRVDWNKLSKIHFPPANQWIHEFYNKNKSENYFRKVGEFFDSVGDYFTNIKNYLLGNKYEND